jgi:hypothetical protein
MLRNTSFALVSWFSISLWLAGCVESRSPGLEAEDTASAASAGSKGRKPGGRPSGTPAGDGVLVAADGGSADCEGDAGPASATVLEARDLSLWPPNHKLHEISVADCVRVVSGCGPFRGEFLWASSDEPIDDKGDGHHAPDILVSEDCEVVSLRSERQGPKDGRVYKLGVRVFDGEGEVTDAVCAVVVDHDQRGVIAADSGDSYRVAFDGTQDFPACGEPGEPDEPPPPADDDDPGPG